jgi:hypothetical protein
MTGKRNLPCQYFEKRRLAEASNAIHEVREDDRACLEDGMREVSYPRSCRSARLDVNAPPFYY